MGRYLSPLGGAGAQYFDNNGDPLDGGKLYTYTAGTSTPLATYSSSGGAANANPIVLDSAGRCDQVWLDYAYAYKFVLKDADDVVLGTWDNIDLSSLGDLTVTGDLGVTGTATVGTLGVTGTATVGTLGVTGTATVGTLGVTGNATFAGTLGVTGAISEVGTALSAKYAAIQTSGTFTVTATGLTTTETRTVSYRKIGDVVTLLIPSCYGTSNTGGFSMTGVPVGLRPSVSQGNTAVRVLDNGSSAAGFLGLDTTGEIGVSKLGSIFTSSGTKGLDIAAMYTYIL